MPSFAPGRPSDLLARLRADQSAHWERGEHVSIESYLHDYPELVSDPETLLALVYAELLWRQEQGDSPSLDEYQSRFPYLADALRRRWDFHQILAGGGTTADLEAGPSSGTIPARLPRPPLPTVPGYEVEEELGRGAMGVVYKARQKGLDRLVAVKVVRAFHLAGPADLARFRTEALAVGRVDHRHVVRVHACGEEQGCPYYVMEYLPGGSLARLLRHGRLDVRRAVELVRQVALGVQAAHDQGVIHRDLKPGNVLLDAQGNARVTDFGLAKLRDEDTTRTRSGAILGTPAYMAPEQAAGRSHLVREAADVWALGVMLFECLTGQRPFRGASPGEVLYRIQHEEPPLPRHLCGDVPAELEAVCLRCLSKEPGQRYPSAGAVARDLGRWLAGEPVGVARPATTMRPRVRRPALVGLATLLGVLLLLPVLLAPAPLRLSAQERVRRAFHRAAPGRPVALYVRGQPPVWANLVVGKRETVVAAEPGKALSLGTHWVCLYELLPPDPRRGGYRLTVEMRHGISDFGFAVGPYVGREEHPLANGTGHTFALLGFCDPELLKELGQPLQLPGRAGLALYYVEPHGDDPPIHRRMMCGPGVPLKEFGRPGPGKTAWRTLVIEARADSIRIRCGEAEAGSKPIPFLQKLFRVSTRREPRLKTVQPGYAPSGGAGLFVIGGAIEVRRALVEPLAGPS